MTTPPSSRPLDALSATYWDAFLESNPLFATTLGDPRFDGRLPDPTPEGQAAARARYAAMLAEADDLDADEGTSPATPSRSPRSGRGSVADLAFIDTGLLGWSVDPLDGIPVQLLQAGEYQPAATPAQAAALLERWRAMPAYTDAYTATLRRSLAAGLVACRAPVDRVVDMLAELLASPDEAWPLLAPLAGSGAHGVGSVGAGSVGAGSADAGAADAAGAGGWTSTERARFATDLRAAVAEGIRPAFERLHDALATEIRPAARPAERPGLCHVPGGEAAYRELARAHTSLDATPDELHRTGLAEIDRIDAELADLAGRTIGTRNLPDALAALRGDPALHFGTRDEVFAKAVSALERADRGHPRVVRSPPPGAVRGRAHGPARGGALDHRLLPPAGRRRLAARAVLHQHRPPGDPAALRGGGPRLPRVHPRAPPPDRHRPGARGPAGVPAPPGPDRVLRGLGPVHGAPQRRDGPLLRRPRPDRRAQLRRLACLAPGRGHRPARDGLDAAAGHRLHARAHRPRPQQHRQRGRPLHRDPGPGPRLQDGPAGAPAAPRRGPRAAGARIRHPRLPRHRPGQRRRRAADPARDRRGMGRRDDGCRHGLGPGGTSPA